MREERGREQESPRENLGSQDCNKDGARWGKCPTGCLVLAGCLVSSAARAPHTSIRSGVQRARCCGPQAVEGRLIQSPPPPHLVAREDPHPSLPRGAPTNSLPHSLSSPPLAVKVHFGRRNPAGEVEEGALCLLHTHGHSPLALAGFHAGSGARLPRSSSELSAHTRARSRPLIHTPALSSAGPPEGPGLHFSRHHPTPEPGLGHFRPPPPISRLECEVWHCVAPDMVGRGFFPTGLPKEEMLGSGTGWRIVPHSVSHINPQAHSLAQDSWVW